MASDGKEVIVDWLDYVASGSRMAATARSGTKTALVPFEQEPDVHALRMEPASGIEPPTCGLRSGPEAISPPHLTPLKHTEDPDPPLG